MEFLQYAVLHLVCSLIGKGHSENMPVGIPVIALKQKGYVLSCQTVCLAGTGGSLHQLQHNLSFYRPHIILKSQYSHTFSSFVRLNGTSSEYIS